MDPSVRDRQLFIVHVPASVLTWKMENLYCFPSCSGGTILLLHSLPVRHLETGEENFPKKEQGMLVRKLEFKLLKETNMGAARVSLVPKRYHWIKIGLIASHFSRKDPTRTCRPNSGTRQISRNQAWKQKLNESISFYYFLKCTLKDTLTAKNGDFSSSTP